jgi:hypothetical protein
VLRALQSVIGEVEVSEQRGGHGQANEHASEGAVILLAQHQFAFLEPRHRPSRISAKQRDRTQETTPQPAPVISMLQRTRVAGGGDGFGLVEATGRPQSISQRGAQHRRGGATCLSIRTRDSVPGRLDGKVEAPRVDRCCDDGQRGRPSEALRQSRVSEHGGRVLEPLPGRARGDGLHESANGVKVVPRRAILYSLRRSLQSFVGVSGAAEPPKKQVGDASREGGALRVGERCILGGRPCFHRFFEAALPGERLPEQVAGLEVGTGAQRETRQPLGEVDVADRPRMPGALEQHARVRPVPDLCPPGGHPQGVLASIVARLEGVSETPPQLVESERRSLRSHHVPEQRVRESNLHIAGLGARANQATTFEASDDIPREQAIHAAPWHRFTDGENLERVVLEVVERTETCRHHIAKPRARLQRPVPVPELVVTAKCPALEPLHHELTQKQDIARCPFLERVQRGAIDRTYEHGTQQLAHLGSRQRLQLDANCRFVLPQSENRIRYPFSASDRHDDRGASADNEMMDEDRRRTVQQVRVVHAEDESAVNLTVEALDHGAERRLTSSPHRLRGDKMRESTQRNRAGGVRRDCPVGSPPFDLG